MSKEKYTILSIYLLNKIENIPYSKHLLFHIYGGFFFSLFFFRSGFNQVFPMDKLGSFSPDEVKTMLCGDQCPVFTRDDIVRYTEPKLGYTRESPAFLKFVNVLVGFSASERKAFLQFTTGCSSLPPGENSYFCRFFKKRKENIIFCQSIIILIHKSSRFFSLSRWPR